MTGDEGASPPDQPRDGGGAADRRPETRFEADGRRWWGIEAWRGSADHGLCYFLPLDDGSVHPDDRTDRRAVLQPGERLGGLPEERLRELVAEAVPLTDTERRFRDAEGRLWLVQSVGPVWAEGGVAEGLTGVLFTSLEGPLERRARPGGRVAGLDGEMLGLLLSGSERAPGS